MTNRFIARLLSETATMLTLQGENPHKIKAYETGAAAVANYSDNLATLVLKKQFPEIPGVGAGLKAAIESIVQTGSFPLYEKLKAETPEGLLLLSKVQGLGTKKIQQLRQQLHIEDIESLITACESGKLAKLKGFGEKTQAALLYAARFQRQQQGKYHLRTGKIAAESIRKILQENGLVCELTGALRRADPVIDNIELICSTTESTHVVTLLTAPPLLSVIKNQSDTKIEGYTLEKIPFTMYITPPDRFIAGWRLTTAVGKAYAAIEAICNSDQAINLTDEKQLYALANLPFLPPELIHEKTPDEAFLTPERLHNLITAAKIRGVLHAHSTDSDGTHSLEAMARACIAANYQYLGITDHSQTAVYANGLKPQTVIAQHKQIDILNQTLAPFRIFKGIESDILNDGSLDYNEEILSRFDFIIASIHSRFNMTITEATDRLIKAIQNPYTRILGHPTGRLLLVREGYKIDHQAVIDACAAYGVAIELNANPWRYDLDWQWIGYAIEKKVKIAICPDAHSISDIEYIDLGVQVARRAGLSIFETLNAFSVNEFADWCADKRPN
jgi:DNA polymerase (family 10)